jgi:hypothetical protein
LLAKQRNLLAEDLHCSKCKVIAPYTPHFGGVWWVRRWGLSEPSSMQALPLLLLRIYTNSLLSAGFSASFFSLGVVEMN